MNLCEPNSVNSQVTFDFIQYGMSSSLPPPSEYLPAKAKVDTIIQDANISSKAFATSPVS